MIAFYDDSKREAGLRGSWRVLLTLLALYPTLKETRREQRWGLLLTPEDVKGVCGKPESDDGYRLTYRVENHCAWLG